MNEYIFTSKLFKGQMIFGYEEGVLTKFLNEADLSDEQMYYLKTNFPFAEDELEGISGKSGKIEQHVDISFGNFWETYNKKVNKKRAEKLWYKLTQADRQVCLSKIKKYHNFCKLNNRTVKDPDTYLRNASWEDELN